ncbi:Rossmann-like and DUF2520 domain-containing protein [Angustibacter luteus]|uniref:Rossmann-like and DUF2520 domain-containing protein n=1 Tax=Angustibacter luteus TaxID=658456 RepID=A0ABW1JFS1_9ACTN
MNGLDGDAARPAGQRPARLDVGVVGAGRVGAVLGAALARAGHRVVAASAVSRASTERAAALLPGVPLRQVPDVVRAADLVLLTVPDDELPALVRGLADTGAWPAGQIVVHTSGRYGVAVLDPAAEQHAIPLALHPAMTFTGTAIDLERLSGCCFGVTAADPVRPMAEALVVEMGAEPVWVAEADRARYHAALAHGSNHLVTLVAQALQVLRHTGIEAPDRVLAPLLSAALDGALRSGDAAVTGPVSRGDAGTVAAHLAELATETPDVLASYVAMARATAVRALADDRLGAVAAANLLDVLASPKETS